MSRNPQPEDDFSFLPTVDDAETLDRETLWAQMKAREAVPQEPPAPELPAFVVQRTQEIYVEAYARLTGKSL